MLSKSMACVPGIPKDVKGKGLSSPKFESMDIPGGVCAVQRSKTPNQGCKSSNSISIVKWLVVSPIEIRISKHNSVNIRDRGQ